MNFVTREEWGARPPKSVTRFSAGQLPTPDMILHHAGTSSGGAARVRAIQTYHMDSQGWRDIAYHYLIDYDGTVYEGRGWGVVGGATSGQNATSHAVCLLGNFNIERPSQAALDALVEVVRWGHSEGFIPLEITGGHRDFVTTSCPGTNLYTQIPDINEALQEEDDMPSPKDWDSADWSVFNQAVTNASVGATIGSGSSRRSIAQAIANTEINVAKVLTDISALDETELSAIAKAVNDELARRAQA